MESRYVRKVEGPWFFMIVPVAVFMAGVFISIFLNIRPDRYWVLIQPILVVILWFGVVPILLLRTNVQHRCGEEACQEREDKITLVKSTFLTQDLVDNKLREMAVAVEELFNVQVQLREDEDDEQLSSIYDDVAKAKGEFWSVHNLARSLDFDVRPKIKDYTTNR